MRIALLAAFVGLASCRAAPSIEGRYTGSVEGSPMTLDFRPDNSVMLYPESMRYVWEKSHDTVFVHGGPQTQTLVLLVRGDSLVGKVPIGEASLNVTWVKER